LGPDLLVRISEDFQQLSVLCGLVSSFNEASQHDFITAVLRRCLWDCTREMKLPHGSVEFSCELAPQFDGSSGDIGGPAQYILLGRQCLCVITEVQRDDWTAARMQNMLQLFTAFQMNETKVPLLGIVTSASEYEFSRFDGKKDGEAAWSCSHRVTVHAPSAAAPMASPPAASSSSSPSSSSSTASSSSSSDNPTLSQWRDALAPLTNTVKGILWRQLHVTQQGDTSSSKDTPPSSRVVAKDNVDRVAKTGGPAPATSAATKRT